MTLPILDPTGQQILAAVQQTQLLVRQLQAQVSALATQFTAVQNAVTTADAARLREHDGLLAAILNTQKG